MNIQRIPAAVLAALLLCVAAAPASAFNTLFMRDSAVSQMTDAEYEQMTSAVFQALDSAAEGETVQWGSEEGAHGNITLGGAFNYEGFDCRRTKLENFAGTARGRAELEFCRNDDGKWKILTR